MNRATVSLFAACLLPFLPVGCGKPASVERRESASVKEQAADPWFVDVARERGIDFTHRDPATPRHLIEETMGSGVAWIDFDADSWPDLLCLQSTAANRLYRNRGDGTFLDATEAAGLGAVRAAFGAAVGDFNNDGWDDLALTHVDGVTVLRNVAGRFVDATATTGLANANPHWGTSCAWGDLDADGYLDLYVCNYVEIAGGSGNALDGENGGKSNAKSYAKSAAETGGETGAETGAETGGEKRAGGNGAANPPVCRDATRGLYYSCPPSAYPLTTHRLFWNRGGERFENISSAAGIAAAAPAPGLAVVIADLDGDRRPDIYVANDLFPAYLFRNRTEPGGPPRFEERATLAGCALGPNGASMSGMCAEVADVDGSGRPALFVTNFQGQPNVLFRNRGSLRFEEASVTSGLGPPSRDKLGFGAAFLDADMDGTLDLAIANGHVYRSARELLDVPYAQPLQLFRGRGRGQFRDESPKAGLAFAQPRVGRGVARADFDRDGRPDLAVSAVGGPVALLRNVAAAALPWIGLELVGDGRQVNRNAVGAEVRLRVEEGAAPTSAVTSVFPTHFVVGGGSYLSAHDRRLAIGLGPGADKNGMTLENRLQVEVVWPGGTRQIFAGLQPNRYWRLEKDSGAAVALPQ